MAMKKVSRRSVKPRGPPRQAALLRNQCDICAIYCFIESMMFLVLPGSRFYSMCKPCGETVKDALSRGTSGNSNTMRHSIFDQEARLREAQRKYMEVRNRLKEEKRRGRELKKLLEMERETERTWWNSPINEQSPEDLVAGRAEMEKLMAELDKYLATQKALASSSSVTSASLTPPIGPSDASGSVTGVPMSSGGPCSNEN